MILDEIHLLGADRGPILEVTPSILYFCCVRSFLFVCFKFVYYQLLA